MRVFNDMQEKRLEILFQRYISKTATDEERQEFFAFVRQPGSEEILRKLADRFPVPENLYADLSDQASGEILAAIFASEDAVKTPVHRIQFIRRFRWVAAAVFILAVSGIVFFITRDHKTPQEVATVQQDIKAPESNKATITLPNGQTILLDTVPIGTLIAGIARKTADGRLVFEGNNAAIAYIVTSNPRNSKVMYITLPDNTEVWLNADTRLQYPTNYNQKDRLISLTGEADFKVQHNEAKLFKVLAGDQVIEDKGTEFNVKAYENEEGVQTTLLEGAVKINNAISLKPGQQFSNNKVSNANLDEVMAWKNGSFYLDGRELGTVANELGRWYDVEVVFENETSKKNTVFGGEMGRDLTLSQAIRILEKLNVQVKLEGQKLIVK